MSTNYDWMPSNPYRMSNNPMKFEVALDILCMVRRAYAAHLDSLVVGYEPEWPVEESALKGFPRTQSICDMANKTLKACKQAFRDWQRKQAGELTALRSKLEKAQAEIERLKRGVRAMYKYYKNEQHDVMMLCEISSEVFYHITNGRISKPNTLANEVIAQFEECQNKETQELIDDETEKYKAEIEVSNKLLAQCREVMDFVIQIFGRNLGVPNEFVIMVFRDKRKGDFKFTMKHIRKAWDFLDQLHKPEGDDGK